METILVVDDEAEVLAIVREMLEGKGYQILAAPNAEEAVRVSSNYSGPIHLLLTDIVMPGASAVKRDAPAILKPFTIERLTEKVQEVLAAKPRSPFDRPIPGGMSRRYTESCSRSHSAHCGLGQTSTAPKPLECF